MDHLIEPWMIIVSLIKGILVAVIIIGIVGPSFIEAIGVAACSSIITGVFLVIATHMQSRKVIDESSKNREKIQQVATKMEEQQNGQ